MPQQGKCRPCNVRWVWKKRQMLVRVLCPQCRGPLVGVSDRSPAIVRLLKHPQVVIFTREEERKVKGG